MQLYFPKPMEYSFCCIYEERAFETAGDDAASIDSFNRNKDYANTTKPLSKGTYYLEVNPMNDIGTESLMVYKTLPAEWAQVLKQQDSSALASGQSIIILPISASASARRARSCASASMRQKMEDK